MSQTFEELSQKPAVYAWLYGVGVALLLVSAWLWWAKVQVQPYRVFWGAVQNGLSSPGVTLEVSSKDTTTTDKQTIQYSLGSTNKVQAIRTLTQDGTTIRTESVGTLSKTYTRYTSIKTDKKTEDGKPLSFKDVLQVWAESTGQNESAQLLPQAALGLALPLGAVPMPIGQLPSEKREDIMDEMRNRTLYQTSYTDAKKERKDGRLLYTYDVAMQPVLYLKIMKSYAEAAGLKDLQNVDPNDYAGRESLQLKLTIDAHSHQLVKVANKSLGYEQRYTGYGITTNPTIPAKAISQDELQKRLGAIQ
jgi:hypothetical protein